MAHALANAEHLEHEASLLPDTADSRPRRVFYLDVLRAFLTVIVVLHHCVYAYWQHASFSFTNPSSNATFNEFAVLVIVINQAYFMSFFFLLAGYFTPSSLKKKGVKRFFRDRLIRLGIPLIVYMFLFGPLIVFLGKLAKGEPATFQIIYLGPLWFVEILLIFTLIYVCVHRYGTARRLHFGYLVIAFFVMLALTFILRGIFYTWWTPYIMFMPSYIAYYLFAFFFGCYLSSQEWLLILINRVNMALSLGSTIVWSIVYSVWTICGGYRPGGWVWESFVQMLIEVACALSIMVLLFNYFKRYLDKKVDFFTKNAYAVYIFHEFFIVIVGGFVLYSSTLSIPLQCFLCCLIVPPVTWLVSAAIRLIPGSTKVL